MNRDALDFRRNYCTVTFRRAMLLRQGKNWDILNFSARGGELIRLIFPVSLVGLVCLVALVCVVRRTRAHE
jgi:hypothetical protein